MARGLSQRLIGARALLVVALFACRKDADPPVPAKPATARVFPADVVLPDVPMTGFDHVRLAKPLVTVSLGAIAVDDKPLLVLHDGVVDPADKEGGARGLKITKLTDALAAIVIDGAGPSAGTPVLQVALDKQVTYRLMLEVLYSAKHKAAGWKAFDLLARSGDALVRLPITLPDRATAAALDATAPDPADRPLLLLVSTTDKELLLWSASQLEGSLMEPKLRLPLADPTVLDRLSAALAEIVARRWPDGQRSATNQQIVLQAEPTTPVQRVAEILGRMRATRDGKPLFPDIQLSAGFE